MSQNKPTMPPPPGTSILARLHSDLLERQVAAEYRPGVEAGQIEVVYISLGKDGRDRDLVMQAFVLNELMEAAGMPGDDRMTVLVLQMALPLPPAQTAVDEVAIALNLANQLGLIGTFMVDEAEGAVILRYPMVGGVSGFKSLLVLEVLSAMRFTYLNLETPLERVLTGDLSAAEFARHAREALKIKLTPEFTP